MKKLFYLLAFVFIAITAKSQLKNGIVAYWKLDETSGMLWMRPQVTMGQ